MAAALYRVAQIVQRDPGGDGNDDGFRLQGGQGFGEHAADEVGLHPDDEDVAAGGDAGDIRYGGYALGTEGLKTLRRAVVAIEFQTGNLGEPPRMAPPMLPQPMQPIRLLVRDAGVSMIFLF